MTSIRRAQSKMSPIDRGWAWVVLGSSFAIYTIIVGAFKCYGMIFAEILARYQKSASGTSTMLALSSGCAMFIGPLVAAFCDMFTCRAVAMTGGIVYSMGFVIPAFCDTLEGVMFSFGILTGVGSGMCLLPAKVMVGRYFDCHRSLANGILYSGGGLGGTVLPFLLNYVIDNVGLFGCLVALAGVGLHTVILGSFYRPFVDRSAAVFSAGDDSSLATLPTITKRRSISLQEKRLDSITSMNPRRDMLLERFHSVPTAGNDKAAMGKRFGGISDIDNSFSTICFSALDIANVTLLIKEPLLMQNRGEQDDGCKIFSSIRVLNSCCCRRARDSSAIPLVDFSLVKDTRFVLFVIACSFFLTINHISMLIPPHCLELGMSKAQVATLLSVQGASDMTGRLMGGVIGDRSWVKSRRCFFAVCCFLALSISTFISVSLTTFEEQAVYLSISSLARGMFLALMNVVLVDLVGTDKLGRAIGLASFVQAFFVTLTPVVIGVLRDWTGTYTSGLLFLGSCSAVSAVCFTFIVIIDSTTRKSSSFGHELVNKAERA